MMSFLPESYLKLLALNISDTKKGCRFWIEIWRAWQERIRKNTSSKKFKHLLHKILLWHLNDLLVCAIPVVKSDVTNILEEMRQVYRRSIEIRQDAEMAQ